MRTLFFAGSNSHYHSLDYDTEIVPLDPKNAFRSKKLTGNLKTRNSSPIFQFPVKQLALWYSLKQREFAFFVCQKSISP